MCIDILCTCIFCFYHAVSPFHFHPTAFALLSGFLQQLGHFGSEKTLGQVHPGCLEPQRMHCLQSAGGSVRLIMLKILAKLNMRIENILYHTVAYIMNVRASMFKPVSISSYTSHIRTNLCDVCSNTIVKHGIGQQGCFASQLAMLLHPGTTVAQLLQRWEVCGDWCAQTASRFSSVGCCGLGNYAQTLAVPSLGDGFIQHFFAVIHHDAPHVQTKFPG